MIYHAQLCMSPCLIRAEKADAETLERWVRADSTPQKVVLRSQIILAANRGIRDKEVAREFDVSQMTVRLWKRRFLAGGPEALTHVASGRGRKPVYSAQKIAAVVRATQEATPPGQTHWTCRTMAKAKGMSFKTVQRIWDTHGLKPHLSKSFKLSKDKRFVEKLTDVVGVYLNPPDKAVVLCVDEKSQIQALDRTQPGLPLKKGRCGTQTHDYVRHGTTTLFAALNMLDGSVVGQCLPRHRHQEFLKFLRKLDAEFSQEMDLHLILDNYGTHKHPKVCGWLEKHPRFKLHFTPTSASWTNLVERWFRELTEKAIRRGAFVSVTDLEVAIENFMSSYNDDPKPFIWTASVQSILSKLEKVKAIYDTLH
jgi:transposase